jgi:ATP-dependent DNA helicase RecG
MSATPIPRSLSFSIYGEISISNIKTKPDGRKNAITSIISTKKINQLLEGIKRKIRKNEQIFWILPTIGSSESEKETVITRFEFLKKIFTDKVGILHGKMEKSEMEMVMKDFQEKKFMILISTTVIEVGINIPTATLMIVEQAERFGLAQLHQLRGRITRGNLDANCVLIHNKVLSEVSKQRLLILKNSNDGFKIAEQDLQLRGAGDFFGTNQSGMPSWKFFIPTDDYDLIVMVKKSSQLLVRNYKLNKEKIEFLKKVFYKDYNFKNFFSV